MASDYKIVCAVIIIEIIICSVVSGADISRHPEGLNVKEEYSAVSDVTDGISAVDVTGNYSVGADFTGRTLLCYQGYVEKNTWILLKAKCKGSCVLKDIGCGLICGCHDSFVEPGCRVIQGVEYCYCNERYCNARKPRSLASYFHRRISSPAH